MMPRRSGVTLIEVLVAIFIMGIGLIALLTLFPIGILRMAASIRSQRTNEAGYNAHKIFIMQNLANDQDVVTDGFTPDLFANPGYTDNVGAAIVADPYGESYPIFVDPIGYFAAPFPYSDWVGGQPSNNYPVGIRRRPVYFARQGLNIATPGGFAQMQINLRQYFTLWDDISFERTNDFPAGATSPPGVPQLIAGIAQRDARSYSWGMMLRRPQTADLSVVDCTVVVFDKRTLALTSQQSLNELVYPYMTYFNPADNTITIDYGSTVATAQFPPPLRPGDWILDATWYASAPGRGSCNANFYRVVSTEDVILPASGRIATRYEVQNPIRNYLRYASGPDPVNPASGNPVYLGTAIVMDGVVEVFEKGPARMP